MVKRALRMTCSAQMHTNIADSGQRTADRKRKLYVSSATGKRCTLNADSGFTMIELMVVIVMVSLFAMLVQMHLFGLLRKSTFRAQVQELVSTMQMAASAAAQSDRRYEVIIDIPEQRYMLRQITNPDLSGVLEEEIIVEDVFSDNCRVAYVQFDDGESTSEDRAKFRAGHSGWAYGGKIVLLDEKGQPYSIVVNRLNRIITLEKGDVELLQPKNKDDVPF
ncbi:MAG: prepilin-type N-terminal cleavage/methylation domain-containing protein [Planctomycetes bacterium]|nr:prepilin-type N-terminal cleavage/methylation domain-containing protein [Planctomycetota bacterium]MCH8119728.1 prepilin-type N-terminal cleavage/methylation domain-containing protein [Planctomycetota bacterium]